MKTFHIFIHFSIILAQKLQSSSRHSYGPPPKTLSISHAIPCESICGMAEESHDPKRDRIKRDTENVRVRTKSIIDKYLIYLHSASDKFNLFL